MKLETLVGVSEVVASLAVVVSLIVLVFEVRDNTEAVRRASYDALTDKLFEWRLAMAEDETLNSLFFKETTGENNDDGWALSGEDRHRFQVYIQALWHVYEQAFYAHRYGDLGVEEWKRFESRICGPIPILVWDTPRAGIKANMSSEFVRFVEDCHEDWQ